MLIDTTNKELKDINKRLNAQAGGWLFESHCWTPPDKDLMQKCYWCDKEVHDVNYIPSNFSLCRKNPAIISLLKKYRVFLENKELEHKKKQLMELRKEIAREDINEIFEKDDKIWK